MDDDDISDIVGDVASSVFELLPAGIVIGFAIITIVIVLMAHRG